MTAVPETATLPETATNARRVALIVAIAFFMQFLDSTIISTSLPQMGASFGVSAVAISIGITVYMLTMAVFVPLSGWLADRFGARNIFLLAIVLFTLASLACGVSQNLTQFVAARVVQGLGSALMTPVGRILVLRNASKSELLNATALITWPALFAPVIGPVLGGFITTYLSWHWNFFINIPLGVVGLVLVARFIPGDREADPKPLDWPGFFLTSAGLALLLYGLERIAHPEDGVLPTVLLVVAGIVIGWLAVRHLRRAPHPLLDLSSFKVLTFAISTLAAGTIFRVAINATPFLLPLLFQVGFGLSSVDAGLMILAYFLGNLGMKTVTTPTLRRFGFRSVLVVNGLIASAAIMACAAISPQTPQALVVALMLIAGLSRSMQFTALNTLAFADIDAAQRSSAATLSSMLQQVAMLFGVAVAAAILNLSQIARDRPALDLVDFRVAFLAIGAIGLVAALRFLVLPPGAGAEVSGHSPGN
ncbi:DHA2 family efflux MFS transporter permease subunit [Mesorhizobium sp. M7A.F.Ca.CA.001.07.2.1]|uniref:DHA2 family efflux MFS transporter permease subunit n=6 Tax=Phyllobacteriaceae TaxID=69277 RepID=UPI000FCB1CFE|nr:MULTISPECIES: DHA2 family efflux MFS transporter permease subunit [Mesorhizobium]MCF6123826.1 DHA2 family efflux MFS transporter permease subunit [Mesorhizobium ciceri]MCQ8812848.1 DHA2 family efflux MFS transporter permease subunit [Mesorhizobium sp. SEMIA396]RUX67553.1 DHA2 family efflux MFS transporter permease subunit [Mesorhizobium sp. M7A.F.Ca.CA.004.08.2.1]RUX99331.1 DHA2 family efflux MFS transporter permease subunit [Mesorhizobium sp. M7A.F.Ca.CA.004.04.1.1]RUY52135.1 DHA2 family e